MHSGLIAFLHHRMGWLPLYASVAQMDPETAAVFLSLLRQDRRSETATHPPEAIRAQREEIRQRLN